MSDSTEMNGLGIQSLEFGIEVLKVIGTAEQSLTIGELATRVGMSKSRLHRYLTSLHRTGFIRRDAELRYTVGPEAMTLGLNAVRRFDIRDAARPVLLRLREELNETLALSVWTEQGPYYLHWVESQRAVNVGIRVGAQVSALKSAGGKVFVAYLPAADTRRVVDKELTQLNVTRSDFEAEMAQIRDRGYATTTESLLSGIASIGCPIFDHDGDVTAAITVVGLLGHLDTSERSPIVAAVKAACDTLSRSLA